MTDINTVTYRLVAQIMPKLCIDWQDKFSREVLMQNYYVLIECKQVKYISAL